MLAAIRDYFDDLTESIGTAWNRFFFTPADPRPLARLRIAVGLLALYWQASYGPDLIRWFGPGGLLPLDLVDSLLGPNRYRWSYLDFLTTPGELWLGHWVGTLILLALTLGIFTRVVCPLALLVVLSYIHRAPLLTGLSEPILAFLLFYLCFAPSGAAYSIDAWRARRRAAGPIPPQPSVAANVSLRLIQMHVALVYLMMGLAKLGVGGETWWRGEALWLLMARPETRLVDVTGWFQSYPLLINAWSHAQVALEIAFGLGIWNRLARPALLVASIPLWLALGLVSGQAFFAVLMLVAGLAFAPLPLRCEAATQRPELP